MRTSAFVSWPSAPLTRRLVLDALAKSQEQIDFVDTLGNCEYDRLIQWSTYDEIDHDLTNTHRGSVLASNYTFRKALIRKHYLSHSIHVYLTKFPRSILQMASPLTYDVDMTFADELDEKWADELYDLGQFLEDDPQRWWILKPFVSFVHLYSAHINEISASGMADRGMGIRLFNTKEALQQIFEEFELSDSEDGDYEDETSGVSKTAVITSRLRHFVIQEYILSPLLFDPNETPLDGKQVSPQPKLQGHKVSFAMFHLRAYCVASGALQLYLYDHILALFCSVPYRRPNSLASDGEEPYTMGLEAHLTNTSLQMARGEEGVRLFDELVGCQILGEDGEALGLFTGDSRKNIIHQMTEVLSETFRAALQTPVHFQPLENAFELYGVDFLVEHTPSTASFQVKILEINAEPAIELTGPRLTWILEGLFDSIANVCVEPFIKRKHVSEIHGIWGVQEVLYDLIWGTLSINIAVYNAKTLATGPMTFYCDTAE
ncbi:hypothetical protein NP233_g6410 [Leucocoprinus birnbaumii]|uniref:Tubulin-tyrosine ligase n=1 Tax=Leucocoprinus birnbaumii TaxID=56174 RepID=A0AAD5YVJ9_9AGAR|nr:hypothetical protein NP233_g6410 [Leucocoprinus birnbaumii]